VHAQRRQQRQETLRQTLGLDIPYGPAAHATGLGPIRPPNGRSRPKPT
jgi:hypothetical protein